MPHILHTEFCTTTALSEWIDMYETDCNLISLSPLSSPDPTPPSSPLLSSTALPQGHTPTLADHIAQLASPCLVSSSSTEPSCLTATHPSVNLTTFPLAVASMPQKNKKPKSQHRRARQHAAAQAARSHRRNRDKDKNMSSS
uniref:Uncharacterized protein n=1 Tax=Psilocybe cubensis TaxID=181762 RepID=A0A8H7Y1X2_PSICU